MCLSFRYLYLILHILYEHEQIVEKLENMQGINNTILIIYYCFQNYYYKKGSETDAKKKARSKGGSNDLVLLASKFNSASSD